MINYQLELDSYSVVLLGSFNPAIFQPLWFSANNLISPEEAKSENVKLQIVHEQATVFSTKWFSLNATTNRFSIETRDASKLLPLRDLAQGTFKILEHTPLSAFGLNRISHFKIESETQWHDFGHHFAPKASWHGIMKSPGLIRMSMKGARQGSEADITVLIESSAVIQPGIVININEHYNLVKPEQELNPIESNKAYLNGIANSWDGYLKYSDDAATHLFSEVNKVSPKK